MMAGIVIMSEKVFQLSLILAVVPVCLLATNSTSDLQISNPSLTQINPSTTSIVNSSRTMSIINSSLTVTDVEFNSSLTNVPVSSSDVEMMSSSILTTFSAPPTAVPRPTPTHVSILPSPTKETEPDVSPSLPLSLGAIIGISVGVVCLFLAVLCCLFCCWYCCFHGNYDYHTGAAEYKVTAQYWVQGSAQYTVTRRDSLRSSGGWSRGSSLSRSRMSSLRSSLGMGRGRGREVREVESYKNPTAMPQFNTPL